MAIVRTVSRSAAGGVVAGFAVVTPCAQIVIAHARPADTDAVTFPWLYPLVFAVGLGVPLGTWLLLRVLRLRHAGLIVVVGFTLSVVFSLMAHGLERGGAVGPAWSYGISAAAGYAIAAVLCGLAEPAR